MNNLSSNKKRKEGNLARHTFFAFCATVFFVLILYPFSGPIKYIGAKGKSFIYSLPVFSVLHNGSALYAENQDLKSQVEDLKAQVADKNLLEQKNSELEAYVDPKNSLLAEVLSTPGSSIYDVLLLGSGSASGIKNGDIVYSGSVEIGKISAVYQNTSEATLFTSPNQKMQGVMHTEGFSVDLSGLGGGTFEALVPKGSQVNTGDVVDDSLNKQVLGTVQKVDDQGNGSFKRLIIALPINPFELKWVSIIIK